MVPPKLAAVTLAAVTEHAFSAVERQAVSILCLGPVLGFPHRAQLEIDEWTLGRPLSEFVSGNGWPARAPA
jgi:hypothetical protein